MKSLTALLVLVPLLAGCQNSMMAPDQPMREQYAPQQVYFSGQDNLRDAIAVDRIRVSNPSNGNLHVEVPLRAVTDMDLTIDYRFSWFDEAHKLIDQPTAWQTHDLHSNIAEVISGDSPSPLARDFQIDIRLAQ